MAREKTAEIEKKNFKTFNKRQKSASRYRSSRICIQYDTSLSRIGIERGERIIEDSKPIGFRKRIREKEKRNGRNPLKIVQWNITAEFMKKIGPSVWSEPEFKSGSFCFPDDCFGSLSYPQALSLTFS
ncbi:hypothetical protein HZH66_000899 [Vespula vulgaris]|uniref:Uncharacterized protein n=1 Tax=Vespula vulgaris TaxID=7454 RepID=A0A834KS90_VESVU|nr:hypothetical protein HZH66_000899 [Vespula vulgaris]